jgi:mycothiol synthase
VSSDPASARVEISTGLTAAALAEVETLVSAATAADGVGPLSEQVMLHLRYGDEAPVHDLLDRTSEGRLAGYANLDLRDTAAGPSAELVVDPALRRRGHGRRLVDALLGVVEGRPLRVWAHGEHPGAVALATSMGFDRVRTLWQLRRSMAEPLPGVPPLPPGVSVRTFRPGDDDDAWVAVNAKAFADHPEQGALTIEDLRKRMAEPWFDPAGFFVAERDGELVGFHWTKVHNPSLGEVYVVGIAPGAQGGGLGKALVITGLRHLQDRGAADVLLYTEADNAPAVRLYTGLGFTLWSSDAMFASR